MTLLKNTDGFSLVELMTVIGIIGIMTGIALPSYLAGQPQRRLKSAAKDLYGAVQQARLLAVKNNQDCSLIFNATSYYYYVDEDGNGAHNGDEKRVDLDLAIYNDVEFGNGTAPTSSAQLGSIGAHSSSAATSITFIPAGTAEFAPDPIDGDNIIYFQNINNPTGSFAVSVQLSGTPKISWSDGTRDWR